MNKRSYGEYPEIHKKFPTRMNDYEVTRVIEELGKDIEDCQKCADYPSKKNNYEPCGCMRIAQENFKGCVCGEKHD